MHPTQFKLTTHKARAISHVAGSRDKCLGSNPDLIAVWCDLGKCLNLSVPQLPYAQNRDKIVLIRRVAVKTNESIQGRY